jgi:hypothetical protein
MSLRKRIKVRTMIGISLSGIKRYFKENPGAPFIIGFQISLLSCAFLLSIGKLSLAEKISVYAFCFVVIGVFLQLVSLLKEGKKKKEQ